MSFLGFTLLLLSLNFNTLDNVDQPIVHDKGLEIEKESEYNESAFLGKSDNKIVGDIDENLSQEASVNYSSEIQSLGIRLDVSFDGSSEDLESREGSLKNCEAIVYKTLNVLPEESITLLQELSLNFDPSKRRGYGGKDKIILRCINVDDYELASVLVHEVGHLVDMGQLTGTRAGGESEFEDYGKPVYADDPSVEFYRISFESDSRLRAGSNESDFVSEYGMSDPFEDFAECYNYYILHGREFRKIAKHNAKLQQKYDFLKTRIFNGNEYDSGYEEKVDLFDRQFDVTVLPYDMNRFFAG